MGTETPTCKIHNASHSDEYFLQHSLIFAESLKDLKNLRIQLYSAAEYFESSYQKHEYKQLVVETVKDFTSKALINTVDHLGTVAYKVDSFLNQKVNEISAARLQFSTLEQKLRTCQGFVDRNGLGEQSLAIKTPKHYKHYKIPESKFMSKLDPKQNACFLSPKDDNHKAEQAIKETVAKHHPSALMRRKQLRASTECSPAPRSFSFARVASNREVGKRTVSPIRLPLKRSGSVASSSTSPRSFANKQRCPSEPRRAVAIIKNPEANGGKELQPYSRKSKQLLKALLNIHWSRKQGVPYRFGDDK